MFCSHQLTGRALAAALACVALVEPAAAQEPRPVFASDVELVTLNLSVLDSAGRPVTDLRLEEISVREGDRELALAILLSPEQTPLDIALALDLSNSMRWREGRQRAQSLIDTLGVDDCLFLLGFSSRVGGSLWAQASDPGVDEALLNAEAFGGTALYDAIRVALTELDRSTSGATLRGSTTGALNPDLGGTAVRRVRDGVCPAVLRPGDVPRRRALVLVSDGVDSTSRSAFDDVRVAAAVAGVPVFPVRLPSDAFPGGRGRGPRRGPGAGPDGAAILGELAAITGGQVVDSDTAGYERLVSLLRGSYLIGYHPAAEAAPRSRLTRGREPVTVDVSRPGTTVLHRPARFRGAVDPAVAQQYVAQAASFLDEGLDDAAAAALDRALAADPEYAPAYHLRALAYAQEEDLERALDNALRAADLGPGVADRHELAMRLALDSERSEIAWEQAVFAGQAGLDLTPYEASLSAGSSPPADLAARLAAPRVAVARPYVESTNPLLDGGTEIVSRAMRRALSAAPGLALVADPTLADFVVTVRARSVALDPPHALVGTIRVSSRAGSVAYAGTLNVRDLEQGPEVRREIEMHVREMADDLTER
jgi:VWFA-related protein